MSNFVLSSDIYVFPCARRVKYDIGSKLSTEENLANVPSSAGRKNYVIKQQEENSVTYLYFVLGGYLVKAKKQSIVDAVGDASTIYANCTLCNINLATVDQVSTTTKVLQNLNDTESGVLDVSDGTNYYFYGIKFTNAESVDFTYSARILEKSGNEWKINENDLGPIGTDQIQNSAVTTIKIADANVTTAKIADANITTAKIANKNVTLTKIEDADDAGKFIVSDNNNAAKYRKLISTDIPDLGEITNEGKLSATSQAVITDANKKITTKDLSVADPEASGNAETAITSISQDSQGKITAVKAKIPDGALKLKGSADSSYTNIFSANASGDTKINVTATIGTALTKDLTPQAEITYKDNELNFAFNGIIGNGFTYKPSADKCTVCGDYYISEETETKGHICILTKLNPRTFTDIGDIRGVSIKDITLKSTNKNIDTYEVTFDPEKTPTTFEVTNAVEAFGYCTWADNIATADYPSYKWSSEISSDISRSISLYFATDYTGENPKLKLADKTYPLSSGVKAGWYRATFSGESAGWTLQAIAISGDVIKFNNGVLDGEEATETSKGLLSATDKAKLNSIGSAADRQANWTETDSTKETYIKNKPTILSIDSNAGLNGTTIPDWTTNSSVAKRGIKFWVQEDEPSAANCKTGDIWIKY